ncbi:MAG TPA: hypothetical protein VK832_16095 [Burkholderiaceae bacterium]|nr:hypothetical protein [Burkholderiaceae bacterium]
MKKSFLAATAGVLAGATLLMCAAPAMAHERVAIGVSVGVPVGFVAPAPVAYGPGYYGPAYYGPGYYGPVVSVGGPYYRGWNYGHGYRGGYHGWHR